MGGGHKDAGEGLARATQADARPAAGVALGGATPCQQPADRYVSWRHAQSRKQIPLKIADALQFAEFQGTCHMMEAGQRSDSVAWHSAMLSMPWHRQCPSCVEGLE